MRVVNWFLDSQESKVLLLIMVVQELTYCTLMTDLFLSEVFFKILLLSSIISNRVNDMKKIYINQENVFKIKLV